MLFLLALCLYISGVFGASPIKIINGANTQDYYLSMYFENIDASECNSGIKNIYIYKDSKWDANDQYYNTDGERYAWDYSGTKFGDMLPISIKIERTDGYEIEMWGIVENLNGGEEFPKDSHQETYLICDGTADPTPSPTPRPTGKPTSPTIPPPTAETICIDLDKLDEKPMLWRSYNNQIYLNGNRFNMKGLNWFGYETTNYGLYGLDYHDEDWYFNWMRERGFNAMRLPFSGAFMNGGTSNRNKYKATIQKAAEYGILVMPDYHSYNAGSYQDGLGTINQADAISLWGEIADLLKDEWNVFIADVFNEPHDVSNDEWDDWVQFCEDVAAEIWSKGVNWMVAVEGTNANCEDPANVWCAWGENLIGPKRNGVTFDYTDYGENRFVYSPHVYGADVTGNGAYSFASWENHFGYLATDGKNYNNEAALIIGEFGTTYQGSMTTWLETLVDYMISIDQRNTFYWCLNPNSGDTGGLLKSDWTTEESGKLAAIAELQPDPSVITYNSNLNEICISGLGESSSSPSGSPSGDTPVSSPTPKPTPSPVSGSSGGSNDVVVAIKNGANQWWFAVTISVNNGGSISSVSMTDKNGKGGSGTQEWDYYKWTNGVYSTPITVSVVVNGATYSGTFSSISSGLEWTPTSSYTEDDGDNTGLEWPGIVGIVLAVILCIGCCIGGGIYYNKNKNKGVATFKETGTDTPVGGDTPDPQPQAQEMPVTNDDQDAQEIEIEYQDGGVTATQD